MKKYRVNVNGTKYEIEVELMGEAEVSQSQNASQPAAKPIAAGEGKTINSPMPGNILKVNVSNGSSVKRGDVLMILEAMKMENEIMAPQDGTITSVAVMKGATVESGDLLCTIQ